jgi:alkyl hydroperoxide reductase subunit F
LGESLRELRREIAGAPMADAAALPPGRNSMSQDIYDTIIIGGGPAGAGAAVYSARKKLKTLVLTGEFGGQSSVSGNIENWIGEVTVTGPALAEKLKKHMQAQRGIEMKTPEKVTQVVERPDNTFEVRTDKGGAYHAKTLIVTSGGQPKRLNVPGEDRLRGNGVAYCSTCDAPFFPGQEVAVVGSGNSALETVIDLIPYANKIYLFIRGEKLKGDPVTHERVAESPKLQIITNAEVQEILGEQAVTGLRYQDKTTGAIRELAVSGVFVAIGSLPNSDFVRDLVDTNQAGEILVDHKTAQTSRWGIFAAGDVTDDPFKQNNISAGDGVRAALSAYSFILNIQKYSPCVERGE